MEAVTFFHNVRFHKLLREEVEGQLHGSYACAPIADGRPDTTDVAPACPHLAQQDFLGLLGVRTKCQPDKMPTGHKEGIQKIKI